MRKALILVVFLMPGLGIAHAGTSGSIALPSGLVDFEDAECNNFDTMVPEHYEVPVVGDYTTQLDLRVHVLAVQTPVETASAIMDQVTTVYEPLAIRVIPTIEPVDLQVEISPDTSATAPVLSTSHSQAFIDASKEYFGGTRPSTADVVYTMLGGELASSVAGQADCVGGIAHDDAAFSVGEATWQNDRSMHASAAIAGHEIAHLLAAHHHFANCAEGKPADAVSYFRPCTLMINDVGLMSLKFSTLEGAVVRRWALDHLRPTPDPEPTTEPEPEPEPESTPEPTVIARRVELDVLDGRLTGTVVAPTDKEECSASVPVHLQRRRDGKWRGFRRALTNDESLYSFEIEKPGKYRVRAPKVLRDPYECSVAVSRAIRQPA